jgi:hypothetical protein
MVLEIVGWRISNPVGKEGGTVSAIAVRVFTIIVLL